VNKVFIIIRLILYQNYKHGGVLNMSLAKVGHYAFLVGIALAVIAALVPMEDLIKGYVILALVGLGLLVGLLNVTNKETTEFLVAAIALIATGSANLSAIPAVGIYLQAILQFITVFVAPAALVVALKAIKGLAEE
jgi:hypothetical protein